MSPWGPPGDAGTRQPFQLGKPSPPMRCCCEVNHPGEHRTVGSTQAWANEALSWRAGWMTYGLGVEHPDWLPLRAVSTDGNVVFIGTPTRWTARP
jgi:hypothetical protein